MEPYLIANKSNKMNKPTLYVSTILIGMLIIEFFLPLNLVYKFLIAFIIAAIYIYVNALRYRFINAPEEVLRIEDNFLIVHPGSPRELKVDISRIKEISYQGFKNKFFETINFDIDDLHPIKVSFIKDSIKTGEAIDQLIKRD